MRLVSVVVAIWVGFHGMAHPPETFRDSVCRVSFDYPADWEVAADSIQRHEACSYVLRPIAYDRLPFEGVDLHSVSIRLVSRPFEAAAETLGFERRGADWIVRGPTGTETPGASVSNPDLRGVSGVVADRCYDVDGQYVGACDVPVAVLGTDDRSVSIRGGPRSEDVVSLVVNTLESWN